MSLYQTTENQVNVFFRAVVTVWIMFFTITSIVMILMMPNGPARSMMLTADQALSDVHAFQRNNRKPSLSVLAPGSSDPCLSLLHSGHVPAVKRTYASSRSMNNSQLLSNSRSGTTAAISLMLGVRFAMDPYKKTKSARKNAVKADLWIGASGGEPVTESHSRTTLSIVAYRYCKKDIALKALSNK